MIMAILPDLTFRRKPAPSIQESIEKNGTGNNHVISPGELLTVAGILILQALVIYGFQLESDLELPKMMPWLVGGFILHSIISLKFRLPFLFFLTLSYIIGTFGWLIGGSIIGIGLSIFLITQVPISLNHRLFWLAIITAILISFRAGIWSLPNGRVILPVVGSLFMFRMILYLYEQKHANISAGFWKKINYFFLLPNLVFVIFPVVDFTQFTSQYYTRPSYYTYRRGLIMMANGILHLFLYRIIYYYFLLSPSDVEDLSSLLLFLITTYLLIVRLAGIFHFSAGVLCLFGFNLPRPFEHYFFAHSFSDIWRRINIYWPDQDWIIHE